MTTSVLRGTLATPSQVIAVFIVICPNCPRRYKFDRPEPGKAIRCHCGAKFDPEPQLPRPEPAQWTTFHKAVKISPLTAAEELAAPMSWTEPPPVQTLQARFSQPMESMQPSAPMWEPETRLGLSPVRMFIGSLVMLAGSIVVVYFWRFFKTSVPQLVDMLDKPRQVADAGLANQRIVGIVGGIASMVAGFIFGAIPQRK